MKALLCLAVWLGAGGCFSADRDDGRCETDADCDGECARTNECVEAGTTIRVELAWTIAGEPAVDETCAPIAELEVLFHDGGGEQEPTSYSPIPCRLGRSTYDKMPPRLDRIELIAYDQGGGILDSGSGPLEPTGTTTVSFDLVP